MIGLTPGGGWLVSPCSAPSGAKRAGSHRRPKMLQYLLYGIWGRDSSLSSSPPERREVLLFRKTLWNDLLKYPTWNMPNVSTGALENPLGILLTGHIGKHKSLLRAYNRHLQMVGQPTVLSMLLTTEPGGYYFIYVRV